MGFPVSNQCIASSPGGAEYSHIWPWHGISRGSAVIIPVFEIFFIHLGPYLMPQRDLIDLLSGENNLFVSITFSSRNI